MPATGNIELQVESLAAKNALEHAVGRDSAVQQDPQLMSALESLRAIVNCTQLDSSGPSSGLAATPLAKSVPETLPTWAQVDEVLSRVESLFATRSDATLHPC